MKNERRIIVADDQERVCFSLRTLLRQQPGWRVVGEAENTQQLLKLVTVLDPDLVLMDWNLPNLPGENALIALKKMDPHFPVIVLSGNLGVRRAALEADAAAFISKTAPPDQLVDVVRAVLERNLLEGDEK